MKKTVLAYVASLMCFAVACQSDQEKSIEQQPLPVASSISKAVNDAPATEPSNPVGSARVAAATTQQQQEILTYLNQARAKSCLCGSTTYPATTPLQLNAKLNVASDKHALDMATYNYFSHTGRDGSQPWDRMTREGYIWRNAGENIAAGYATTRAVVDGWLKSPGHCANIMNPNFKEVGVGYAYGASSTYKHYWVNDFGTQR